MKSERLKDSSGQKILQARLKIPGLDPRRVDTLYPGVLVLRLLMERIGVKQVRISEKAIREGVIYDFIQQHQEGLRAEQEIPHIRRRQVLVVGQTISIFKSPCPSCREVGLKFVRSDRVLASVWRQGTGVVGICGLPS